MEFQRRPASIRMVPHNVIRLSFSVSMGENPERKQSIRPSNLKPMAASTALTRIITSPDPTVIR
jgi:hypothetical protein